MVLHSFSKLVKPHSLQLKFALPFQLMVTALLWRALAPKGNLLEEGIRHFILKLKVKKEGWHPEDLGELVREVMRSPLRDSCC